MYTIQKLFAITATLLLLIAVNAFSQSTIVEAPKEEKKQIVSDTVPQTINKDFEKLENELKIVWKNVEVNLNKIDWAKIENNINKTLKNINFDKVIADVQSAITEIDTKKIAADIKNGTNKNFESLEKELQQGLKEIEKIDVEKIKSEIGSIKIDINPEQKEKFKQSIKNIEPELKKKMQELKKELEILKEAAEKKKNENVTLNLPQSQDALFPFQI